MDPFKQYLNLEDGDLDLPPMGDEINQLRSISPDLYSADFGHSTDSLLLNTDYDPYSRSEPPSLLGYPYPATTSILLNGAPCDVDYLSGMRAHAFDTSPYPDMTPRLSPDSSPASSVASSSALMTPENGVSLAEIESSPLVDTIFCDSFPDDDANTGCFSPYFAIEDPLTCDAAGYPLQEMLLEDIACSLQAPSEPVHRASTPVHIPSPLPTPSASVPHSTVPLPKSPIESASQWLTLPSTGVPTRRPKSRASSAPPSTPAASALFAPGVPSKLEVTPNTAPSIRIPSLSPALASVALSPIDSVNEDIADLFVPSRPATPSPVTQQLPSSSQTVLGKRHRLGSLDDEVPLPKIARRCKPVESDDDEWVPTSRRPKSREFTSSSPLAPLKAPSKDVEVKMPRRTPKSSRSYRKSSSKTPRVQCQLCKKSFSRAGDVARHQASACPVLKQQNEILTFTCPLCGDELSRKDSRTRHFKGRHPEVDPAIFEL